MFMEGEIDWVLVLGILAVAGHVVAAVAIGFAITNRGRHVSTTSELDLVQKAAQSADKRLFETLNAIPVALVETDRQGKFTFANRAAHQLLGRRDAELLGLRFHSATWGITYPDGRPVPPDLLPSARALRGQTVKGFQHLLANPATRRKMLVSVTAMPIETDRGEVIGSIAAIVETEGLTTPETIAPAPVFEAPEPQPTPNAVADPTDDLIRRVFEVASSALVVVGTDGLIRAANGAAMGVLGRSVDVAGADFADLFLGEDERVEGRQAVRAAFLAPAGEADPFLSPNGPGGALRWRALPLADAQGHADALLLAGERADAEPAPQPQDAETLVDIVDTTEIPAPPPAASDAEIEALRLALAEAEVQAETARLDAEAARAHAVHAEIEARRELDGARRMESVGRLTGGVAQDFNALLTVMTSALDLILKQVDDPSRVRRLGEAALAAGQRGEALTRRLTAFSQGEDGAPMQVLDAGALLNAMEGRLRALAGLGVDLMIDAPPEPALARVDPVTVEGAVRALVQNAVEAVGGQGSVAVRLEALMEGGLRLSVRDTGPGLDRDLAARALEPFFTTRPGQAGLGLSQAHAFARQSGGRLSIDSAPGEGAEVAISLPSA
ncbi:sensor histidine kinase [Brevundimonas sp.]|uniref:sensor histidine kinase n=1 Tax=Brevundimonas sp. TaxID=1871086 RepID=UPI002ABB20AA|nr:ATP-binding protein [Brevundimonas sp.]MDZ4361765.1 PAS domain-containing protein [Brevundimonas sp.]